MDHTRKALRDLIAARAFQFGDFILSTGKRSHYYFDCKRVTMNPEGASLLANAYLDEIAKLPQIDAIGGLTMGADPIVGAVMMRGLQRGVRLESFYVRKEAKKHGTKAWIENPPPPGSSVVIVDDVVTTGKSVIDAIKRTDEAGYKIVAVICVVDRLQDGGADNIRHYCQNYIPLFDINDFPEAKKPSDSEQHQDGTSVRGVAVHA